MSVPSPPPSAISYSRCLEHDGQLFSIQLVPPPAKHAAAADHSTHNDGGGDGDGDNTPTPPRASQQAATAPKNRTASAACGLEERQLDFAAGAGAGGGCGEAGITPLHRWFGLKQYVLLRSLGESGESTGMGADQLLWATTVAAGNCKCSVPVLVSCDWDGLVDEDGPPEGGSGGDDGGTVQSGASCKGYSAPGGKGVACSVSFQTAWTQKVKGGLFMLGVVLVLLVVLCWAWILNAVHNHVALIFVQPAFLGPASESPILTSAALPAHNLLFSRKNPASPDFFNVFSSYFLHYRR